MSDHSAIEWTDASWNPVRGCSRVSEGCRHCYAEGVAARFAGPGLPYEGLARSTPAGPRWTGKIRLLPELLEEPLRWRKPRRIFVNSMSDLFHEDVPDRFIAAVFGIMAATPRHTFQILTKRPERARAWFAWLDTQHAAWSGPGAERMECDWRVHAVAHAAFEATGYDGEIGPLPEAWPLPNVHLGVSVEDRRARARITTLEEIPAAARIVSCEPLLEDLGDLELEAARVSWVIAGGESGRGARPCDPAWIRSIVAQCRAAHVPVFVKQLGAVWARENNWPFGDAKGGEPSEWPADLRVREWPEVHG